MSIEFLYFDLGNVLLTFSNQRAAVQMAELAGTSPEQLTDWLLGADDEKSRLWRFERGDVTEQEFHDALCEFAGRQLDRAPLELASSDMFAPIPESFELVSKLHGAGHRLGVLSNTNPWHWRFVTDGRFELLGTHFEKIATSFDARSMKPEPGVYQYAIDLAGVPAEKIFFVDDRLENVEGACEMGIDAVRYTDHQSLVSDLRVRGIAI